MATANLLGIQPHSDTPDLLPQRWERESGFQLLIKSRLLLGLGKYAEALVLIDQLLPLVELTETRRPQIVLRIMKAQAELMLKQPQQAYQSICLVIEKAQSGPYCSLFLEEAPFAFELVNNPAHANQLSSEAHHFLSLLQNPNTVSDSTPKVSNESEKLSSLYRGQYSEMAFEEYFRQTGGA